MSEQEPPPAYQETQQTEDGPPTDGPDANTQKERPPDEPAPDGEGVLASPLRRMMCLGVILLLYYILSFWQPVYWLAAAANYCNYMCNNYTSTYGGCYETTVATCEATCDAQCDVISNSDALKDALDTMYENAFSASGRAVRLAAFAMIVLGFIAAAIGIILGYFAVKKGKQCMSKVSCALLGLGGLMSILGAIIFLATWHEDIDFEETLAAIQIMVFIEYLLPGICAIILAIDVWNALIFNEAKKRMLALTVPFAVFGLMGGCLYAYIINWEPDPPYNIGYEFPLYGEGGCIAAGYFILGLMSVAQIVIAGEFVQVDGPQSVVMKFVISILMFIGAFITAVGYWAMINGIFDCEYDILSGVYLCEGLGLLYGITGDMVGPSVGATYAVSYESQFKCYYVSYTFFILLITALNVYDMDIVGNYAKVRLAQKAASAAA